ncbi:MAG TPA: ABC transporter substrate-binding protein [Propionibacteriaceae bacterium]|nr:ABC transporter substrate-binding protein [Propionibacteriaceae bacterium]
MTIFDSTPTRLSRRSLFAAGGALTAASVLAGCAPAKAASAGGPVTIGYFPNVTHAPGLVADAKGYLGTRLAAVNTSPTVKSFNAGPDVIQAILSGSLDISYIGPNPTINAYAQSKGEGIRVIAGSTSGGASLVVRAGIISPADLKGTKLATPQLGNTQDVALRFWLKSQGLTATKDGGGEVSILPQANSAAVQAFKAGAIDGGWLPEPYASSLVKAGGTVLLDERTLWPGGQFVTTNIIVRTAFLTQRPQVVRAFLDAHLDALDTISKDPSGAQAAVAAQIKKVTSQEQDQAILASAWKNLAFGADPLAASLRTSAQHAEAVGLLASKPTDAFAKLWSLDQLNAALDARGRARVSS